MDVESVTDSFESFSQSSFSQISNDSVEISSLNTSGDFDSSPPKRKYKIKKRKLEDIDSFVSNLSSMCCAESCTWKFTIEGFFFFFFINLSRNFKT